MTTFSVYIMIPENVVGFFFQESEVLFSQKTRWCVFGLEVVVEFCFVCCCCFLKTGVTFSPATVLAYLIAKFTGSHLNSFTSRW